MRHQLCDTCSLTHVLGDAVKLKQVLMNLIDNALTFFDKGCKIQRDIMRDGAVTDITVTNHRWGIPEEDIRSLRIVFTGKHGDG